MRDANNIVKKFNNVRLDNRSMKISIVQKNIIVKVIVKKYHKISKKRIKGLTK